MTQICEMFGRDWPRREFVKQTEEIEFHKNVLTGHSDEGNKLTPAMKILSSSCFPRKRRVDLGNLLLRSGMDREFHLLIEELKLDHSHYWTYFRMSVGKLESLI